MKYFLALFSILTLSSMILSAQNPVNFNLNDYQQHQKKLIQKIMNSVNRLQNDKNGNNKTLKNDGTVVNLNEYEKIISDAPASEAEIDIAINPTDSNNIVVSPIFQDRTNQTKPITCPVYYSTNFGESWTKSDFDPDPIDPYDQNFNYMIIGGGDPMFAFDDKGRLYLSWIYLYITLEGFTPDSIYMNMLYAYSDNGGKDWTYDKNCSVVPPESAAKGKYNGYSSVINGRMLDKQWMASDLSESSPYKGTVYLAALGADLSDSQIADGAMFLWKKLPDNDYFEKEAVRITGEMKEMQGVSLTVDANGWVHVSCLYADAGNAEFYHYVSKDGGNTFEQTGKITDFYGTMDKEPFNHTNNNNTGLNRLYPQNNIVADASQESPYINNIYFSWTANGFTNDLGKGFDAYFSRSLDSGMTWKTPYKINNDTTDNQNFYPFLAVSPKGVVCAAWYDRRNDENDTKTDYYLGYSFDGGKSFANNIKITSQPTDFAEFTGNNQFGVGEYNTLVATEGWCFAVWADGRVSGSNLDLYIAKVPIKEDFTGVNEVFSITGTLSAEVFPNPVSDVAMLNVSSKYNSSGKIIIVDLNGNNILEMNNIELAQGDNAYTLDLSALPAGVYFAKIVSDRAYTVKKFIVK
jgi:hypothetical protein